MQEYVDKINNKHLCNVMDLSDNSFNSEDELNSILSLKKSRDNKTQKIDKIGFNSPTFNDMEGTRKLEDFNHKKYTYKSLTKNPVVNAKN